MLFQLLRGLNRAAKEGKTMAQLGKELGISPAMLEQLIEQLARLGYLEKSAPISCAGSCSHCAAGCDCHHTPSFQMWSVTAKGEKVLNR